MLSLARVMRSVLGLAAAAALLPACSDASEPDRPAGVISLTAAALPVAEDVGTGTVVLSVSRSGGSNGAVTVDFTTNNGTALAGSDYTTLSGTLGWADGDATPKTITVTLADDAVVEGAETFTVALSNNTGGATLGAIVLATVTIADDDAPAQGVLQLSQAVYAVGENAGTLTITVTRSGGTSGAASVEVLVSDGTAAAPGDYTAPLPNPVVLNWADADGAAKTFDLAIVADAALDGAAVETVGLALQNPTGAVLGTVAAAGVEITDADQNGSLAFTVAGFNVSETTAQAVLTVTRSGGTLGAASVQVADAGTGTALPAGVDYTFATALVTWADGEGGPKNVLVDIVDDATNDGDRTVDFLLQNAAGATLGAQTTAQLTVQDDEAVPVPGELTFSGAPYAVAEATGTITISVTRQNGTSGAVSVTLASADVTASSAVNPAGKRDYIGVNTVLSWANGESGVKSVVITIQNNDPTGGGSGDTGSDETFTVALSGATGGATIVGSNPETVTITDD